MFGESVIKWQLSIVHPTPSTSLSCTMKPGQDEDEIDWVDGGWVGCEDPHSSWDGASKIRRPCNDRAWDRLYV